ncbi:hypothetical protein EB360_05650 [Campylobacter coli]|nr:hypothetical protein [Campylobacter coli]MDQ17915.1 hypothetical protein [Campylobacter coli]
MNFLLLILKINKVLGISKHLCHALRSKVFPPSSSIRSVGGKIKCRKRKIKCRIFATNYLSFNLKLKL